jgi:phosphatidylinositol alpha-mannosyltransferase
VAFLGRVGDEVLRRWFRTARVYVSMSGHEACGITLLEGLAAGAGVVAADIPAYREVAARAGPGAVALTPLDATPAALAQVIRGVAARAQDTMPVAGLPSWDAVAAQTMRVYRAVARPGR